MSFSIKPSQLFIISCLALNFLIVGCGKNNSPSPKPVTPPVITAQYTVSTFSGNGSKGSSNGDAASTSYFNPYDIVADAAGNIYVADFNNNLIRKITPDGISSIFVGNGSLVTTPGTGTSAGIVHPVALTIDSKGNLYVADIGSTIVKITTGGILSIFAGGYGATDGLGTVAKFNTPSGLVVDANDNIYVADDNNFAIRKITPQGLVSTFAGNLSKQGSADGIGAAATFSNPVAIAIDGSGNLYVGDVGNRNIRKITSEGMVTTIAGSGVKGFNNAAALQASFSAPTGLAVDTNGNIYVSDNLNNAIRKITPAGVVSTFAGSAGFGFTNGLASSASFFMPNKIIINSKGEFYIADTFNNVIRKIVKQ